MKTQQEQIHELREQILHLTHEVGAGRRELDQFRAEIANQKPWWRMKGAVGPLASIVALGAMVVGYIQNWPADAMAILTAVAGGGGVTGIIGRLQREGRVVAPSVGISAIPGRYPGAKAATAAVVALAALVAVLAPAGTAEAMSRVYEVTTTTTDAAGNTVTVTEQVSKKVLEARERTKSLSAIAEAQQERYQALSQALPPRVNDVSMLSAPAQLAYMEWGRSAGLVASNLAMAEALDPETTSPMEVAKSIELATINKGLNWARVILGTPGGAVLIDRGFDFLQGVDPGAGGMGLGEGAVVFSNIGHRVKDGGTDGGGGTASGENGAPGGGFAETGVNESPINITFNNRSANQQSWDSTYTPVLEFAGENGFTSPVVGEGGTLSPSAGGGLQINPELF